MGPSATSLPVPVRGIGVIGDVTAAAMSGRALMLVRMILGGVATAALTGLGHAFVNHDLFLHVSLH